MLYTREANIFKLILHVVHVIMYVKIQYDTTTVRIDTMYTVRIVS